MTLAVSTYFVTFIHEGWASTLYRQAQHICNVSILRIVRIDWIPLRTSTDFSGFLTFQITFYLWLL